MTTSNFETKTYNGVSIIVNTDDGYINASQMCSSNGKKWRIYNKSKSWNQVKNAFERRFSEGVQKLTPSYYLKNVAPNRRLKNESTKEFYLDEKIQIEKRPDLIV